MTPQLKHCLFNEMKLLKDHWMEQYRSFDNSQMQFIDTTLNQMLTEAQKIKASSLCANNLRDRIKFSGDNESNEFIHVMCCCFIEWIEHNGVALQKELYRHSERCADNWFPVVIITEQINELSVPDEQITVYRGCHKSQLENEVYRNRQPWTTDVKVAKKFAFDHPSTDQLKQDSVVIKAVVARTDILWDRGYESEMVLRMGFNPIYLERMDITYDDYLSDQNITVYDSTLA
ncbi:hypothetical protein H5300_07170 [Vibrio sp. SG41-7]|uniref:hypothetical protein n=1 Tax=Vibrio sp. SG41-7 TaxID=2760973 RepID=UPI00160291DA|nr:hypothetical protein [Vibrio sp. SG41-7]MBB1463097.1 hypothetical protein [Vibrio sp. SG41-7]